MSSPRPAATVLLLREDDGPASFSVFMVRRSMQSSFMPGAHVFPGGAVDAADHEGAAIEGAASRFRGQLGESEATAHLRAAVREVEEEALFHLPDTASIWPFARWITPPIESRRFDAWFLLARLPDGAAPSHDAQEVTASEWVDPKDALARYGDGRMILAPPTWYQLWDLARFDSLDAVFSDAKVRAIPPVEPRFEQVDDAMALLLPGDTRYPSDSPMPGPTRLLMREDGRWWGVRAV
jgi:8-oxo-dGTP pyrophosphatase MutT (NUDIX family)